MDRGRSCRCFLIGVSESIGDRNLGPRGEMVRTRLGYGVNCWMMVKCTKRL